MDAKQSEYLQTVLQQYNPTQARVTANRLRQLWLQFEPANINGIKAELREQQETVGIPVPKLKAIGKAISKVARTRVNEFLPLIQLLWNEFGREGRVVAVIPLGAMELTAPEKIIPEIYQLCQTCITWEDADRLAMDALEPIIRKQPEKWLHALEAWLEDDNLWVRRAAITTIGRLPMKRPEYTLVCLNLSERLLYDDELDVKRAVSFAIRISARGEIAPVREFLARHVPPENSAATWVLCDCIRSMTKQFLPEFTTLLPRFEAWQNDPSISAKDRRSIDSAIKTLKKAEA
ncbi:MAG: hypothetical protein HN413_03875 [Chloroflexi bacterium]|jgi:3-methyladenine DNA glycosylase AlkD|nr:hypothetical protein [Chloroflexota bacterium]